MSKSPSLRRIQADIRELALDPSDRYHASPLEDDMFEWHFTIRGADDTDFEGGIYHGRILLPPEYPFKPPHILFLTPSGRFETNTKVCLSFSAYHPELWQPAWGIRLILEALISFLPTPADGAIGSLDWTSKERKRLAVASQTFCCHRCGKVMDLLPELKRTADGERNQTKQPLTRFQKEIEQLKMMQMKEHELKNNSKTGDNVEEDVDVDGGDDAKVEAVVNDSTTTEQGDDEVATDEPPVDTMVPPTVSATEQPAVVEDKAENVPLLEQATTEGVLQQHNDHMLVDDSDIFWLTDSMLNISIFLLSVICFLLGRKCSNLYYELRSLS